MHHGHSGKAGWRKQGAFNMDVGVNEARQDIAVGRFADGFYRQDTALFYMQGCGVDLISIQVYKLACEGKAVHGSNVRMQAQSSVAETEPLAFYPDFTLSCSRKVIHTCD
jgi:hypothetical protein